MIRAIVRVLFALVIAWLAAGTVSVLFAIGPQQALAGDPDKLARILELIALAATHSAVFSMPFALLSAAISEWQGIRSLAYHLMVGMAIALAGFAAQYLAEAPDAGSILNSYAAGAFAAAGLAGGFFYWMLAGRRAGAGEESIMAPITPPASRG